MPDDTPGRGVTRKDRPVDSVKDLPPEVELVLPAETDALVLTERTRELGRFLRTRRARINPEQVGLPIGRRRRVSGLRREEVAVLAGLSPTWYTYLEQGRHIRPSSEVLDSLARVLVLSEEERRYMHLLAFGHPPRVTPPTRPAPPEQPEPTRTDLLWRLVRTVGAGPNPAYVGNQYADVIAWNDATTAWFTDFGSYPLARRNMLWWMLTDPQARERILNWADDVRDVVARLRAAYATRPDDPRLVTRLRYLAEASPEFRRLWNSYEVREQLTRPRHMIAPGLGRQSFQIVVLRLTDDPFLSLVTHLPIDSPADPTT